MFIYCYINIRSLLNYISQWTGLSRVIWTKASQKFPTSLVPCDYHDWASSSRC